MASAAGHWPPPMRKCFLAPVMLLVQCFTTEENAVTSLLVAFLSFQKNTCRSLVHTFEHIIFSLIAKLVSVVTNVPSRIFSLISAVIWLWVLSSLREIRGEGLHCIDSGRHPECTLILRIKRGRSMLLWRSVLRTWSRMLRRPLLIGGFCLGSKEKYSVQHCGKNWCAALRLQHIERHWKGGKRGIFQALIIKTLCMLTRNNF